jgi:hypothetical protein
MKVVVNHHGWRNRADAETRRLFQKEDPIIRGLARFDAQVFLQYIENAVRSHNMARPGGAYANDVTGSIIFTEHRVKTQKACEHAFRKVHLLGYKGQNGWIKGIVSGELLQVPQDKHQMFPVFSPGPHHIFYISRRQHLFTPLSADLLDFA